VVGATAREKTESEKEEGTTDFTNLGLVPTDRQMACFIHHISGSMTATVLWVVNKIPATLKQMPSRTDIEEVVGHWLATTTAEMKLAWLDTHTAS
jgi:hypothetical protein